MGYDGTLKFDTSVDTSGFNEGTDKLTAGAVAAGNIMADMAEKAGKAVVEMGKKVVDTGAKFDTAMSQLAATMGTSVDAIQELSDKAKELGATTAFTATEAAQGLNILAMAGLDAEQQIEGIGTVLNLASAGALSLEASASYVTGAVKGFSDSMGNAQYYADLMAKGATLANTSVSGLGEAMSGVAASAANYSQNAESVTLALLRLAEQNITGSEATTALNRAMMDLYTPTSTAQKALDKLGVSAYDLSGNAKDFNDVVDELSEALAGMSEEEANAYKNAVFSTFGLQAFNKMTVASADTIERFRDGLASASGEGEAYLARVKELTAAGMDEATAAMMAAQEFEQSGSAAQQAATQLDNLKGQITLMNSAMDGLSMAIYSGAAAGFRDLAKFATDSFTAMQAGFEENGWSGMGEALGEALSGLAQMATDSLPDLIQAGADLVVGIATGMESHLPEFGQMAIQLITTFGKSFIEGIPNIISAGADLIGKLADGVREGLPDLIPVAMEAILGFSENIRESAGGLVDAGLNLIKSLAESVIRNIPVLIETVPEIITNFCGIINDNAPKLIATGIELLGKLAMGILQAIPALVANIPQIIQAIASVFTAFNWVNLGKSIITFITDGIKSLATSIPQAFTDFCTNAHSIVTNFGWGSLGRGIIESIKLGVQSLAAGIPTALKGIATTAAEWFKNIDWWEVGSFVLKGIASGISGSVGHLLSAAKEACKGLLSSFTDFFKISSPSKVMEEQGDYLVQGVAEALQYLPDEMSAYLQESLTTLLSWGADMADRAATAAGEAVDSAAGMFQELPNRLWSGLSAAVSKVVEWGANTLATASAAASQVVASVSNFFSQLPGKIQAFLQQVISQATQWAAELLLFMGDGASAAIATVISVVSNLPGQFAGQLAGVISKVVNWGSEMVSSFHDIGVNVIQGLINGIASMVGKLYDTIKSALSGLVDKAKSALGINSPSKVFAEEVGRWIPPGVGRGMEDAMPELFDIGNSEMEELAAKMRQAIEVNTGEITVRKTEQTTHAAEMEGSATTVINNDNRFTQNNDYHVPVATPSETSKAQREAARKLVGGVE